MNYVHLFPFIQGHQTHAWTSQYSNFTTYCNNYFIMNSNRTLTNTNKNTAHKHLNCYFCKYYFSAKAHVITDKK